MAGIREEGFSGRITEVDVNNNKFVNLPTTNSQAGPMGIGAVVHDGAVGASRLVRAIDVNVNRRVVAALDNLLFQDAFSYNQQNTAIWNVATSGGALIAWNRSQLGTVSLNYTDLTVANSAQLTSYKMFPLFGGCGLSLELDLDYSFATDGTTTLEWGWFQASGTSAPTDGVLFRMTGGVLYGVLNNAGTETTLNLGSVPSAVNMHSYTIRIYQEGVEFWIDNALYGVLLTPNSVSGPASSNYQPICVRTIGTSTTVASLDIGQISLYLTDVATYRPWAQAMAGMGNMGSQWPPVTVVAGNFLIGTTYIVASIGTTNFTLIGGSNTVGNVFTATGVGAGSGTAVPVGTTAYYGNSFPNVGGAGVVLTNTTQTTYIGLGGQFDVQPTLAQNTDGILCDFTVPAGTPATQGRSLVITGIRIQGLVTQALTNAGPVLYEYSLAYGGTAVSLATAEAAAAKAFRRIGLGQENYGGGNNVAAGTLGGTPIVFTPSSPIMVSPNEHVQIAVKNTGTVTSAGVITVLVTFDAHWE